MAKQNYSGYQKKVINNYYQNLDKIGLQRLGELVTELYLADTDKKKQRLWEQAQKAIEKLKIQPDIVNHIIQTKDVQILAKNLQDWLRQAK